MTKQDSEDSSSIECVEDDNCSQFSNSSFEVPQDVFSPQPYTISASQTKGLHVGPAIYLCFGQQESLEETQNILKTVVTSAVVSIPAPVVMDEKVLQLVKGVTNEATDEVRNSLVSERMRLPSETSKLAFPNAVSSPIPILQQDSFILPDGRCGSYENRKDFGISTLPDEMANLESDGHPSKWTTGGNFSHNTGFPPRQKTHILKSTRDQYASQQHSVPHDDHSFYSTYSGHSGTPQNSSKYSESDPPRQCVSYGVPAYHFTNPFLSSSPETFIQKTNTFLAEQPLMQSNMPRMVGRTKELSPDCHSLYSSSSIQSERPVTSSSFKPPLCSPNVYQQQPSPFKFPRPLPKQGPRYSTSPDRYSINGTDDLSVEHNLSNQLQRVKFVDEQPRPDWVPMERPYVESSGFRLGIPSGHFFRTPFGFFVTMKNGAPYTIALTNTISVRCNVNLHVDDKLVLLTQLPPGKAIVIDGPQNSDRRFVFFRAEDAPYETGIQRHFEGNGVVKAEFIPEISHDSSLPGNLETSDSLRSYTGVMNKILRSAWSENDLESSVPTSPISPSPEYRSVNLAKLCTGGTALQGKQRLKTLDKADDIMVDNSRKIVLQLRLLARRDDPNTPSQNEEICPLTSLRPPKIEDIFRGQGNFSL